MASKNLTQPASPRQFWWLSPFRPQIRRFLDLHVGAEYAGLRSPLLYFSFRQWLAPSDVAAFVDAAPGFQQDWGTFSASIRSDASLQLVWAAHEALAAMS